MAKILYSLEKFPPEFSGAGLRAYKQEKRLTKKFNHEIHTICLTQDKLTDEDEKILNVKRLSCPHGEGVSFPFHRICTLKKTKHYLNSQQSNFDIIHFMSFTWISRAIMHWNLLSKKPAKTILDVTLQGQDDPVSLLNAGLKNKIYNKSTFRLLNKIDYFIVGSEDAKQSCMEIGILPEKITIEPHPCDETEFGNFKINKAHMRKKLNLSQKEFIFLAVGRIQERKNQLLMLKAFKQSNIANSKLILAGPYDEKSEYFKELMEFATKNNLLKNLVLLGNISNVNEYMYACDVLLFCSKSEGFPNVVAEAMMSGLPIISTYGGAIEEYLLPNCGTIIKEDLTSEEKTVETLSSEIIKIKKNIKKFPSGKIRMHAIKQFSASIIDKKLNKIYMELIKK